MKRTICTSLLLSSVLPLLAGPVGSSIEEIMKIPGITVTDMPKEEFEEAADYITDAKIMMPDESMTPKINDIFASLPEDSLWLSVVNTECTVLMYGEEIEGSGNYTGLMKVDTPDQNLVIVVEGTPEAFRHVIN